MDERRYDVVIIGGGPAGYTAALYCARNGYSVAVVEKLSAGGQMASTDRIDNYPGFEEGIDGFELGERMRRGAERFGAITLFEEVTNVSLSGENKTIFTNAGEISARAVVLSTGAEPRELGLKDEKELIGRGVAYCATCDGMRYKGKTVVVTGGGNSAVADALYLAKICKKVYLVHRRDSLRASKVYTAPLSESGVEILWNSRIEEILHDKRVTGVRIADVRSGEETILDCDALFIAVGRKPETEIFKNSLELDSAGYIIADESTKTSLPGVFAVGDVRTKAVRQIVTATADGAVAAHFIEEYLL